MSVIFGNLRKMPAKLGQPIEYSLTLGEQTIALNPYIGHSLQLRFTGNIHCVQCGRKTRQSYQQGYCFPCMQRLAECNYCIIHPEKCLVHQGSCSQDDWAHSHCVQSHHVYLANSTGLKVGITRCSQLPTRWIDQGATQGLPIFQVANRYQSGIIEVCLKQFVNDRTNWRKLVKQTAETMHLPDAYRALMHEAEQPLREAIKAFADDIIWLADETMTELTYPVQRYPEKIVSLSLDKTPIVSGVLYGIKGQYLLMDIGVLNLRKFSGYEIECSLG